MRRRQIDHEIPTASMPDIAFLLISGRLVDVLDGLRQGTEKGVEVRNIVLPTAREIRLYW